MPIVTPTAIDPASLSANDLQAMRLARTLGRRLPAGYGLNSVSPEDPVQLFVPAATVASTPADPSSPFARRLSNARASFAACGAGLLRDELPTYSAIDSAGRSVTRARVGTFATLRFAGDGWSALAEKWTSGLQWYLNVLVLRVDP